MMTVSFDPTLQPVHLSLKIEESKAESGTVNVFSPTAVTLPQSGTTLLMITSLLFKGRAGAANFTVA